MSGPQNGALKAHRVLAVDDREWNVVLLRHILEANGYTNVQTTTDPSTVPAMFASARPDLVLLDLHMPGIDGFELMEQLAPLSGADRSVAFLVLTADDSEQTKRRALSLGAWDFLTKPFDQTELLLRVRNLLHIQQLQAELHERNVSLADEVAARTHELEQARVEILDRLALAGEYRDDATQEHARRIGRTAAQLARALRLAAPDIDLLERAAPLHDIGKIGIPDSLLLKPSRLSEQEYEQIKRHTTIGAQILSGSHSPVLRLAESIALTHHERWDGTGYPCALDHEQIPLAGRIVAIADVFDALANDRPYKPAWPVDEAVDEILGQAGRQFDPQIADAFATLEHQALIAPAG